MIHVCIHKCVCMDQCITDTHVSLKRTHLGEYMGISGASQVAQ